MFASAARSASVATDEADATPVVTGCAGAAGVGIGAPADGKVRSRQRATRGTPVEYVGLGSGLDGDGSKMRVCKRSDSVARTLSEDFSKWASS